MKVAIIGAGISGLMVADQLNDWAQYTLFEAADYLGGHANTHAIEVDGQTIQVDTGFIVFNEDVYRHFNAMLEKYGVESIPSDMSFAVSNRVTGLEYNATNLRSLFCQKANLFKPKFYRMLLDIKRFYGAAEAIMASGTDVGIMAYLQDNGYSDYFIEEHIIPMVSALWSGDFATVHDYPLVFMLQFMKNHQMLQLNNRPEWRTIKHGSQAYVQAMADHMTGEVRLHTPVLGVKRETNQVLVTTEQGTEVFDQVVFATHTDTTLRLLQDPTAAEQSALAGIPYVENQMALHTDASLLPRNRQAWASWSVNKHAANNPVCTVNYYMNLLQSLPCDTPVIVSLNQNEYIDPDQLLLTKTYHHPIYTRQTLQSQQQIQALQGQNNTHYCGAYLGWGFHEDGARSGVEVSQMLRQSA
ncbi:NAD(P)/FAD-dependent oxidoreductase [Marinicella meishanensis]|uniref:NAD(P)/FAD-dependent oxidoreductase n=1 Tax=Marinicella meishanensis TaxID=2873263 RepID=UPI001CBFFA6F|nr:FAD-dependent oxidoreductase [Marinicella sp. NBU2979]